MAVSSSPASPPEDGPRNAIAKQVVRNPSLTYEDDGERIVIVRNAELLVRKSAREASGELHRELSKVARNCGTLAGIPRRRPMIARDSTGDTLPVAAFQPDEGGPAGDVEIWRLTEPSLNSIHGARRLREFADEEEVETFNGPALVLPAVSPHHVAILSARAGGCPAGPPHPAPPESSFVEPPRADLFPEVTVLDSGYIHIKPPHPPHVRLDERVTLVDGEWLDTLTHPPSWLPDRPDGLYTDVDGRLDGISGHGTFIAGLIAHIAPEAKLKVVGLRNQEVLIAGQSPVEQLGLFETEIAIAHAMLAHGDTDVMQCGFAFPTLDDYPSLPFAAAMQVLTGPEAPREGIAVVAPAGNEESIRPYWPAALPDVIGVASTNAADEARAWFSNWGQWCDCCTRGERVFSTFIYWDGPIEGEPLSDDEKFSGWARWDGTSFAAPKVSAAIAKLVASNPGQRPFDAWAQLVAGSSELVDTALSGPPGVALPHLRLG